MKKILIILTALLLNSCAILDTIDIADSYVQYIETGRNQNYFIIDKVANTHNKKLGKYNYTFKDNNGKIKLFWNEEFQLNDSITIVIYHKNKINN